MVKDCPNCGCMTYCLDSADECTCTQCGMITKEGEPDKQVGLTRYKFPGIDYEYIHVFESKEEMKDFMDYVKKNLSEYTFCRIETPKEIITIV